MCSRLTIAAWVFFVGAVSLPAQRPPMRNGQRETAIERWSRMSPEQRQRALARLPPERRQRILERLRQYEQLSPAERQALRQRYNRFSELPPDQQAHARALFRRFSAMPEDRRRAMRRELQQLRSLPEPDREARMASEDFRNRFSPGEKEMLLELTRTFNQNP